jgi:radical SAM protein with 4Fe4S-binding SPASM domain
MSLPAATRRKLGRMAGPAIREDGMIHYTVTESCPFRCRGCINALTAHAGGPGEGNRTRLDRDPVRDAGGIGRLIRDSGKDRAVIVFYGGEPMLRPGRMQAVSEALGRGDGRVKIRYMTITSGHYLLKVAERFPDLMRRMWLTAVSVDGTVEQHNRMRTGTDLAQIQRELAGFARLRTGEVLIWSTLRPSMSLADCYASFRYFLDRGEAEHFFWHWDEAAATIEDLDGYRAAYLQDLEKILAEYLQRLAAGQLLSIVHINELLLYLFTAKRRGTTACAVEKMANFDIAGDGRIHACADLPETMDIGRIEPGGGVRLYADAAQRLTALVSYRDVLGCRQCGVEPYCGGRCPVQIHLGGIDRARQYCFLMRDHVAAVKNVAPAIVDAMLAAGKSLGSLYRSARLAKYTDVTP